MLEKSSKNSSMNRMERRSQLEHVILIHIIFAVASTYITIGRLIIYKLDGIYITTLFVLIGGFHFYSFVKLLLSAENFVIYKNLSIAINLVTAIFLVTFILYLIINDVSQVTLIPQILALIAIIYSINMLKTNQARYVDKMHHS